MYVNGIPSNLELTVSSGYEAFVCTWPNFFSPNHPIFPLSQFHSASSTHSFFHILPCSSRHIALLLLLILSIHICVCVSRYLFFECSLSSSRPLSESLHLFLSFYVVFISFYIELERRCSRVRVRVCVLVMNMVSVYSFMSSCWLSISVHGVLWKLVDLYFLYDSLYRNATVTAVFITFWKYFSQNHIHFAKSKSIIDFV